MGKQPEANVLRFPSHGRRPDAAPRRETHVCEVIGDVLRSERHAQERTLQEVADEAAVSLSHLSDIERGAKDGSSEVLTAITRALDLDLSDVLERAATQLRSRGTSGFMALAA